MGNHISQDSVLSKKNIYKPIKNISHQTKIAIWQLPYGDTSIDKYDTNNNFWLEDANNYDENEIMNAERDLRKSLNKYKVDSTTITYSDNSKHITSKYPNGNQIKESYEAGHAFIEIKDSSDKTIAEKIYNNTGDGCKILYKYSTNGNNSFIVTRFYSYNPLTSFSTDIIDFGYSSSDSYLIDECHFEREHYTMNGQQVNAEKIDDYTYSVKNENGENIIFKISY